jgi:2',3'-cyclic-nucleotide 2'-phosphodiesterase (5'-nucleotidase family)
MIQRILLLFGLFAGIGCSTPNLPLSLTYKGYPVNSTTTDTALTNLIQPYAQNVNKTMGTVIGFATSSLVKKLPESGLGNFMADCMQQMASKQYHQPIDIAFMNQGGIRASINKGNITVGNVYELMPFDNLLVVQEVKGAVLEQFFQLMAADGGWPISAGSSFVIQNKKAINIIINGKPLDPKKLYLTANTDYVANGGSNAAMLKNIPFQNRGYLLRDALIDQIKDLTKSGKPIDPKIENRVSISNE